MLIIESLYKLLRSNKYTSDFVALLLLLGLGKQNSYLRKVGWYNSFHKITGVDKGGEVLPWYSYAAIDFLSSRINGEMAVFEYGSGNSTIWWAKRVSRVVSCEHDEQWFSKMKSKLPENVTYMHFDLVPSGDYSKAALQYDQEFDVIIIDGRDRVNCAKNSLCALKDTGVIVWDDGGRNRYQAGYDFLVDNGFKRLDFSGLGPINYTDSCTSVFYRAQNCLGL